MADPNTAIAKLLPFPLTEGRVGYARLKQMRREFNDFWIEVYPPDGPHGTVQIMGLEYFSLPEVKSQFYGQIGVELGFKTYDQWNQFMGKLRDAYDEVNR
jgi:hypothetical protein